MKRKRKLAVLAVMSVMTVTAGALTITGCGHEHTYSDQWSTSATQHWHASTCEHEGLKKDEGDHVYTDDADESCNTCGYVRTIVSVAEKGTLSGVVTAYGEPLGGVKVTVGALDTLTDRNGAFSLADVEIKDGVTVKFEKADYATTELTVNRANWQDRAATLNAQMKLAVETGTLSGTVTVGGVALQGATVTLGTAEATTGADGTYRFENVGMTETKTVEIAVTHPACEALTDEVTLTAGETAVTKDLDLTATLIPVLNKTYFELADMQSSAETDFVKGSGWQSVGIVETHNEGVCLHVGATEQEDMTSAIYQKLRITADNSNMMFRVRAFLREGQTAYGKLAVRIVDLTDYAVDQASDKDGEIWHEINSNGFLAYEYDLSEYIGKDVVMIIGSKVGGESCIERIRLIGADEDWVLPFTTASDLAGLPAEAAQNISGIKDNRDAAKAAFASWNKVGSQSEANEGWLFCDADYAAKDATDLRVFAYKKLTFNGTKAIVVDARTFGGDQNNVFGRNETVIPQLIIRLIGSDGTFVNVKGNLKEVHDVNQEYFYFTFDKVLQGDYTFVIGMARGQRLAIGEILFYNDVVESDLNGTVMFDGAAVEGVSVNYRQTTVVTDANGAFAIPVVALPSETVTLKLTKDGFGDKTVEVPASEIAGGKDLGNIILSKAILPGLSTDDFNTLTTQTSTKFADHDVDTAWSRYGYAGSINEGTCFERQAGQNGTSYLYAKFTIDNDHRFMKFNAFKFDRGSGTQDQEARLQVKVVEADGTVTLIAASKVFCAGNNVIGSSYDRETNTLISNNTNKHTEGVYDFGSFIGKTVIIVIQEVTETVNGHIVCFFNEIAFRSTNFYASGVVKGTVKDAQGNAMAGVSVNTVNASTTTAADGTFALEVAMGYTDSVTLTFVKVGYENATVTVTGAEIEDANGEKTVADVTLNAAATVESIVGANADSLTALDLTSKDSYGSNGGKISDWQDSGYTVDHSEACIPLGEFVYAKVKIDADHAFMKINARGKDGVGSKMLVSVYVNGKLTEIAPSRVYGTTDAVIEGNYLLNNRGESYNEGVYDFSAYIGQEIIIVVQTIACLDGQSYAYTASNEFHFFATVTCDKGDGTNYYAVPASTGTGSDGE